MKFLDEFRDPQIARKLVAAIAARTTRPWTIMEICGGQTHSIIRSGLDALLPPAITLAHGPGCPVCVTPIEVIDAAIALTRRGNITLCSFGDMLRVPGSGMDLQTARAQGGQIAIVYSPLDAVALAARRRDREVVFFAVGFETTAPANALAVLRAEQLGLDNFSLLVSQVRVPPAITAILSAPDNRVQGFLAAGHVCTVMGTAEYTPIAQQFGVPIVVTGFEPVDILRGIRECVNLLEAGRAGVANAYARAVQTEGNVSAQRIVHRVFTVIDRRWRGLGVIPQSGFGLRPEYARYDAVLKYQLNPAPAIEHSPCEAAEVLRGIKRPSQCAAFGTTCTPEHPLGAPMVSSEGACAAYYRFRQPSATATAP